MQRTEMPKRPRPRTKTVQVFVDELFWAKLVGAFRDKSIAAILSPLIRERVRAMLREHGVDPDAAFERAKAREANGQSS